MTEHSNEGFSDLGDAGAGEGVSVDPGFERTVAAVCRAPAGPLPPIVAGRVARVRWGRRVMLGGASAVVVAAIGLGPGLWTALTPHEHPETTGEQFGGWARVAFPVGEPAPEAPRMAEVGVWLGRDLEMASELLDLGSLLEPVPDQPVPVQPVPVQPGLDQPGSNQGTPEVAPGRGPSGAVVDEVRSSDPARTADSANSWPPIGSSASA